MSVKWDQDENIETSEKPTVFLYSRGCDDDPIVTFSIFIRLSWFPVPCSIFMPHPLNPFRLFMYSNLHSSHASDSLQD